MNGQPMPQNEYYTPETGFVKSDVQPIETEIPVPQPVVEGAQQMAEQTDNIFAGVKPGEAIPKDDDVPKFDEIGLAAEDAWPEKEAKETGKNPDVINMAESSENLGIEDPTELFEEIDSEAKELIAKLERLIETCAEKEKQAEADEVAARKAKLDATATKEKAEAYKKRIVPPKDSELKTPEKIVN